MMMASPARRRLLAGTTLFAGTALVALAGCGPVDHAAGGPASDSPAAASSGSSSGPSGGSSGDSPGDPSAGPGATGSPDGGAHSARPQVSGAHAGKECRSSDLRVTRADTEAGGMGHAIVRLVFRNASSHACWMKGYPGVSYVTGDDGHQVGGAARRDRDRPPSAARIWLIPNAHAYASLDQVNPHNYPTARCDPTTVRGMRVYPPDEASALYVPGKTQVCAKDGTGRPTVSAITKTPR